MLAKVILLTFVGVVIIFILALLIYWYCTRYDSKDLYTQRINFTNSTSDIHQNRSTTTQLGSDGISYCPETNKISLSQPSAPGFKLGLQNTSPYPVSDGSAYPLGVPPIGFEPTLLAHTERNHRNPQGLQNTSPYPVGGGTAYVLGVSPIGFEPTLLAQTERNSRNPRDRNLHFI